MIADRVPPHSEQSESCVLGSVFQNRECFQYLKSDTDLRSDSFYIPVHRLIWEAMEVLFMQGRPIDTATVAEELKRMESLDRCGGRGFLDGMEMNTPSYTSISDYAAEVSRCASLRAVIKAADGMLREAYTPDAGTGKEVAARGMTALSDVLSADHAETTVAEECELALAEWDAAVERRRSGVVVKMQGLATGLPRVDYILDGLQPGLIVLGARPSVGKTTLEGQIVGRILKDAGGPILRVTRDSLRRKLAERDMCREAYSDLSELGKGYMKAVSRQKIVEAKAVISKWPQRVVMNVYKLPDLIALIRADVQRRGTKLVTIDFIQCFSTGTKADGDRNGKLEAIMLALKDLVFSIKIPILILSQFNRDKESAKMRYGCNWLATRPVMEDLRDSGSLEQGADVVILMSKVDDIPDIDGYMGNEPVVVCDIAKHKQGATGVVMMKFFRPQFTMGEITESQQTAVMKFLHDEEDIKVRHKKPETVKPPYYETLIHALMQPEQPKGPADELPGQ